MKQNIGATEYYTAVGDAATAEMARLKRHIAAVSWARLVVALAAIAGVWLLWGDVQAVTIMLVASATVFLALVKLHDRLFGRMSMQKAMKQVAVDDLHRTRLELDGLDGGDEYIDTRHAYSYDLDLFGRRSVFALLNATATPGGRDRLARNLIDTGRVTADIESRQEAVAELSAMHDFRTRLQALGIVARGNDDKAAEDAEPPQAKLRAWQRIAIHLFPTAMAVLIVLAVAGMEVAVYIETVALLSLLSAAAGAKQVGRIHADVEKVVSSISVYHNLLAEIEQHRFSSPLMQQLQGRLGCDEKKSSVITGKLSKLLANLDQRYNWLSYVLLNILLQWDYRQVRNVEKWLNRYSPKLAEWRDVLACTDELCSLATFSFCSRCDVFPAIDTAGEEGIVIEARKLGHPLIPDDRCVCNDVRTMTAGNFMVVTGANMAGKSTYLRTVGVNYLLALIGAPIRAAEMKIGIASLFTGLRTTDSLGDGESYFFAELRRLQSIVQRAEAGERLLVILDEILKGTNSADKQKGSLALVGKLVKMNVAGIIATHDLVLGTLADRFPGRVFNCCFEAEIDGDTLHFDYKLHDGVARNLNAYFLMQHMGIV